MQRVKFKIHTLGCKVNQYDSRDLKNRLFSYGFESADSNSDLIIVNTCAVTKTAIKKDRRVINKLKKDNPSAKLVVMGCWPQAYRKETEKIAPDLVWGTGAIKELSRRVAELMGIEGLKETERGILISEDRSRYFVKIQDGCEQFCSYCIIPYTRGGLKSRSASDVKREVKMATEQGFEEVVLTGIHLGLYGAEKDSGKDLVGLLKELVKIKKLGRIRLSSIEANEVSKELIELIKEEEKICPHLHIPLQAGSDKILEAMNRPYTVSFFREKVEYIRSLVPDMALTTDVIVGFPGEGEKEFQDTVDLIKELRFSRLHVFPFSVHEATPAAQLEGRVDDIAIKERTSFLRSLSNDLEKEFKEEFKGRTVHPVVENFNGSRGKGRTEYYFEVFFTQDQLRSDKDMVGKIIKMKM